MNNLRKAAIAAILLVAAQLFQLAACASVGRQLKQGMPQPPPLLPLPSMDSLNAQQRWNQAFGQSQPQNDPAALLQQHQQQQLLQQQQVQQQQQQLRAVIPGQQQQQPQSQQQQQAEQHTSFDYLVKSAQAPSPDPPPGLPGVPVHVPAPAPGLFGSFNSLKAPALLAPGVSIPSAVSLASAGAADECLPEANTLVTGACLDFVAAFQADTEALSKLSERDFRQAVAIGPTPSDQCCIDAAAYVRGGCSCDVKVAIIEPNYGLTSETLRLVAKGAVMACPRYNIVNPCTER